jgi:hypothetical protein
MNQIHEAAKHNYYLISIATSVVVLTAFVIGKFTTLEANAGETRRQLDGVQSTLRQFESKYITKDETLLRLQQIENNLNEIKELLKKR